MSNINFASYVIRAKDGSIDLDETLEKFEADVVAWEEAQKTGSVKVLSALHKVFDKNPGKAIPMGFLVQQVSVIMNATTPEAYADVASRVPETVKSNPALFEQTKGPHGGTRRLTDKPTADNTK